MRRQGFTLIELLVVIAIVALTAAILFPVFAQARENARRATCQSNERQTGLATLQYLQDNDGGYPMVYWENDDANGNYIDSRYWDQAIQPYVEGFPPSVSMLLISEGFDNKQTNPVVKCPDINGSYWSYESYAINADYLNPMPNCTGQLPGGFFGVPVSEGQVEAPAATVFVVDIKPENFVVAGSGNGVESTDFSIWADAPATYTAPVVCGYWAWGTMSTPNPDDLTGDYYDGPGVPGPGDEPISYTGATSVRHTGGTDVLFCDGHVQWMTPGRLAAGTNWHVGISANDLYITDISQYLWSLKKEGDSGL